MVEALGTITVNLSAVSNNWLMIRQALKPATQCAAVVKANAYGLGVAQVAQALYGAGCRDFYVAHLAEGVDLRRLMPLNAKIYVLQGCAPGAERSFIQHQLIPVLVSLPMFERWRGFAQTQTAAPCVLKINTGMNRLGLALEEFYGLLAEPQRLIDAHVRLLMSHLACADDPSHPLNQLQQQRFNEAFTAAGRVIPGLKGSLANSAGVFLGEQWQFDMVRPGIALYGGLPRLDDSIKPQPVVSVTAPVIQTRALDAGEAVGYGAEFRAAKAMRVAIVGCGYADGFLRALSGRYQGWYGDYLPLLGRVSMDSLVFDISSLNIHTEPREGDVIELIGPHVGLEEFAASAGTNSYEILTRLGSRLKTRYEEPGL